MKTYEWMAAERGHAHYCERGDAGSAKPVCGARRSDFMPATNDQEKCPACLKGAKVILRYQEAMGRTKNDEGKNEEK